LLHEVDYEPRMARLRGPGIKGTFEAGLKNASIFLLSALYGEDGVYQTGKVFLFHRALPRWLSGLITRAMMARASVCTSAPGAAIDSETTQGNYGDPAAGRCDVRPKMVRGEVGFAGLRLDGRLRDERPNRIAFTSLAPRARNGDCQARSRLKSCDSKEPTYHRHGRWAQIDRCR
jgi:hypothetical protein